MTERLNAYTLDDDLVRKRDDAVAALYHRGGAFAKANYRDIASQKMKELAEKIPRNLSLQYGKKDMIPFRKDVDYIVQMIAATDDNLYLADFAFREELQKKEKALQSIMENYYKERMWKDGAFMDSDRADAADVFGVKHIQTIDRLEWDYRRRLGNVILKQIRFIRRNTYRYDKTKKHKTNDKKLKRKISISNRIIRRSMSDMFGSIMQWFSPQTKSYSNRLKEIEEEMKAEHEREKRELQKETAIEAPPQKNNSRYNWGKD